MLRYLTILLPFCFALTLAAQVPAHTVAAVEVPTEATPRPAEVRFRPAPAFPGGHVAFASFLNQQLEYPELAETYAIEGTVVVRVLVHEDGRPEVLGVQQSLFAPLDEAALAAAANLPRMLPAVADGVAIARMLHVPFRFKLD
jgi:protein TonB